MQKDIIDSQLNNVRASDMYFRQLKTLACNVFTFEDMPVSIDLDYVNRALVEKGAVVFFEDEALGLLALPFTSSKIKDVYGRPTALRVTTGTGYTRTLDIAKGDKYVIMYDNTSRYSLIPDILQYASRLALLTRTHDINIDQQKTPRIWKTSQENQKSVEDIINKVDSFKNKVITYNNIDLDDTEIILAPAPFVADKISVEKEKIWNEYLRLIGIANLNVQKKERAITDEILSSQGGTIASRYSRFATRQAAVKMINELFNTHIKVSYYDGEPTTDKEEIIEDDEEFEDEEVEVNNE